MKMGCMMELDRDKCIGQAEVYFRDASGIYGTGKELGELKARADEVIAMCESRFTPAVEVRFYDDFILYGRQLSVGGETFDCPAFELIDPGAVTGVYAYVLTAGDFTFPQLDMTDQVLADIWGTSLTEAVKDEMIRELGNVSDNFGPGLYGMDLERIFQMTTLTDFGAAGVTLGESGVMDPVKSYSGLLFRVTDRYTPIAATCQDCSGNVMSCRLCSKRR